MRVYNATDRIEYIDIAKGILIIFVVFGHITTLPHILTYGMKAVITTFHMPAFFIINGMLTKAEKIQKTPVKQFLLNRSYRLLIPYVFFEIMGGLWQMLFMGRGSVNLRGILYGIFTIHCHVGADWFLPTIFFAEIGLFLLVKICSKKYFLLVSGICFMVAFLLTDITYLVACCRRILIALSFILIGFSCKKLFMKKNIAVGVVSGLLTISIAYMNGIVDLSARQFGNPLLYILGSLIGTYYVLSVSQCLFGTLAKLLGRIGRSSLTIMGTHQNLQVLFNVFCGSVYPLPLQILVCFATIPYEILMVNLCEKFVPFLVGIPLPVKRSKKSKRITQNERTQQN